MPFTIDAVTQWIVQRYRDQISQRGLSAAVGTTFFSLLQSLLYEYPEEPPGFQGQIQSWPLEAKQCCTMPRFRQCGASCCKLMRRHFLAILVPIFQCECRQ
jgi:hypothetical protein